MYSSNENYASAKRDVLAGSNIFLIVFAIVAAERRMRNSKPSLETRVTYSLLRIEEVIMEIFQVGSEELSAQK